MPPALPPTNEPNTIGPLTGVVIIIILLIAGGVYVLTQKLNPQTKESTDVGQLNTQGTSTNISDIKADVDSTNFDDLDNELNQIEAELKM